MTTKDDDDRPARRLAASHVRQIEDLAGRRRRIDDESIAVDALASRNHARHGKA